MRANAIGFLIILSLIVCPALALLQDNNVSFYYNITTGMGTQTNYAMLFRLSNLSGVSGYDSNLGTNVIYTNGTTRADWMDINYTDITNAPQPFWPENNTQTQNNLSVWALVASISTDNLTQGKWHFGNASQSTSTMNMMGTFPDLADDMLEASYNTTKWPYIVASGGVLTQSDGEMNITSTAAANYGINTSTTFGGNYSVGVRAKQILPGATTLSNVGFRGITASTRAVMRLNNGVVAILNNNGADSLSNISTVASTSYNTYLIKRNTTSSTRLTINKTTNGDLITQTPTASLPVAIYTFASTGSAYTIVDWIFVRKYVPVEPTTSLYSASFAEVNATSYELQDVWMEGEYLQTFVVTDATTDLPINNVTVTDSDGDTTTTASNGTAWLTESFGAYTVLFSASGYDAKTVAYVFDSNATHYVELSPSSTDTNYTGPDVTTYPKYVTFHIKEGFGNPVQDVNVSILAVSTSTGNWDWVLTLLGIPLDEVAVNGTEMYQTTDSMGTATFYVIPTAKYNVTFTKTGYTISSMVLVPQDDDYIIWAEGTGATFYENDYDELAMVNISVQTIIINDTHAFINMSYNDTLAHTTGGFINVTQKNASPWGAPVTVASFPAVSSSFTNSTIITHTGQVSGSVACNVSHTDFGQVERSSPWSLKGEAVHFLGFGSDISLLVALGIMMLTVMLAGAVHARHTVVAMAFEGWIFYAIDWFAALEARGVSETVILLALTLLTILGFVAHFEVRKRKEKY